MSERQRLWTEEDLDFPASVYRRVGIASVNYARNGDPVAEAFLSRRCIATERAPVLVAAFVLGGERAVEQLLRADYVFLTNATVEDLL